MVGKPEWLQSLLLLSSMMILAVVGIPYMAFTIDGLKRYEVPDSNIVIEQTPESIGRGESLIQRMGCGNCHGEGLEGRRYVDNIFARITAPSLRQVADKYDASELDGIIRYGVKPDGTSIFAMPSDVYYFMSDEEVGAIIAYLRELRGSDGAPAETMVADIHINPIAPLVMGQGKASAAYVAALIDHGAQRAAGAEDMVIDKVGATGIF